jgi:hypothetical protein
LLELFPIVLSSPLQTAQLKTCRTRSKSLYLTAANGGRGQTLVELKDTIMTLENVFQRLFTNACSSSTMKVSEFQSFIAATGTDLDESAVQSQFSESVKYPDDEDDEEEIDLCGKPWPFRKIRILNGTHCATRMTQIVHRLEPHSTLKGARTYKV